MDYVIKPLREVTFDYREQAANLYVESFYGMMKAVTKDKNKLKRLFLNSFNPDAYYVCIYKRNTVVGIMASTTNKFRSNNVSKAECYKVFGRIKGILAYFICQQVVNKPMKIRYNETFLESLAVSSEHRGHGIATKLFNYVHENCIYDRYILDVIHGNTAIEIYKRLGYKVFKIEKNIGLKILGIKETYYMESEAPIILKVSA